MALGPGPWIVRYDDAYMSWVLADDNDEVLAIFEEAASPEDARALAALPQLIAACRFLVDAKPATEQKMRAYKAIKAIVAEIDGGTSPGSTFDTKKVWDIP